MKVRIWNDGSPAHRISGTRMMLGDAEVSKMSNVEFRHKAGDPAKVSVDVLALNGLDIELDAEVSVRFTVFPGYTVIEELTESGGKRYRAVRSD